MTCEDARKAVSTWRTEWQLAVEMKFENLASNWPAGQ